MKESADVSRRTDFYAVSRKSNFLNYCFKARYERTKFSDLYDKIKTCKISFADLSVFIISKVGCFIILCFLRGYRANLWYIRNNSHRYIYSSVYLI